MKKNTPDPSIEALRSRLTGRKTTHPQDAAPDPTASAVLRSRLTGRTPSAEEPPRIAPERSQDANPAQPYPNPQKTPQRAPETATRPTSAPAPEGLCGDREEKALKREPATQFSFPPLTDDDVATLAAFVEIAPTALSGVSITPAERVVDGATFAASIVTHTQDRSPVALASLRRARLALDALNRQGGAV